MNDENLPTPTPRSEVPQPMTAADLAGLGEIAQAIVEAVVGPQVEIKREELKVESEAIAADERGERRLLIAIVAVFLSVAVLAGLLIMRSKEELGVGLIDRILYFLAGGLGGWGVAKARSAAAPDGE